jgi:hypothetical protein
LAHGSRLSAVVRVLGGHVVSNLSYKYAGLKAPRDYLVSVFSAAQRFFAREPSSAEPPRLRDVS